MREGGHCEGGREGGGETYLTHFHYHWFAEHGHCLPVKTINSLLCTLRIHILQNTTFNTGVFVTLLIPYHVHNILPAGHRYHTNDCTKLFKHALHILHGAVQRNVLHKQLQTKSYKTNKNKGHTKNISEFLNFNAHRPIALTYY